MDSLQAFVVLAPLAAVSTLAAWLLALRPGAKPLRFLPLYLAACFLILSLQLLEVTSEVPELILVFSRLTYLVLASAPVFWFLFILELTGTDAIRIRRLAVYLAVVPVLTFAAALSDPWFHLLWSDRTFRTIGAFTVNVVLKYGPWFWVHCGYSYGLYLLSLVLLAREFLGHHSLYRRQVGWIAAASLIPLAGNLAYVFRLFGPAVRDNSGLWLALSGLLFAEALRRHRLDGARPLPRRELWDLAVEPTLVVDPDRRIVDLNRAAVHQLGAEADRLLGAPVRAWLPGLDEGFPGPGDSGRTTTAVWIRQGRALEVDLAVQALIRSPGADPSGYLVAVRDLREPTPLAAAGPPEPVLSRKERQVLELVAADLSNKEIAQRLHVSESTVKSHVHSLLRKRGVSGRGELARGISGRPGAGAV